METYAIVQTGGKQHRVQPGDTIRVESLDAEIGSKFPLTDVRMVSKKGKVTIGEPVVTGAKVVAEIVGHGRGKKIIIFKYKNKIRYRKKTGHRQGYTELVVKDIQLRNKSTTKKQEGPEGDGA